MLTTTTLAITFILVSFLAAAMLCPVRLSDPFQNLSTELINRQMLVQIVKVDPRQNIDRFATWTSILWKEPSKHSMQPHSGIGTVLAHDDSIALDFCGGKGKK